MGCLADSNTRNDLGGGGVVNNMGALALQKLSTKLAELTAKRDEQTPKEIAKGNYCSNPCYEFNMTLTEECPKCKGAVVMEYENEFTKKQEYNSEGKLIEKTIYNKNACSKFEFNDSIAVEDYSFGALCAYFDIEEKQGTTSNHYMVLDGERIDLGSTNVMNFLFVNQKKLLPEKNGVELLLSFTKLGEPTILLYNQGGFERMPLVCLYRCSKCGHKYHIMQTSPFMYRDKTKDVVGETFKQQFGK
jgi:uncharacterized protein YbaR (Trm112 family)